MGDEIVRMKVVQERYKGDTSGVKRKGGELVDWSYRW